MRASEGMDGSGERLRIAGKMPNATKDFDSDGIHEASLPKGDMTLAQPFQGWVRSTEDPTSPERDGRLQLQGISVRTDVEHPALSRPVGTQCNRKFVAPNKGWAICQRPLRDNGKS